MSTCLKKPELFEPLNPFAEEVIEGLSLAQKSLSCKWFYDETGSRLFEQITKTAEYYPTRVETRLLVDVVKEVAQLIPNLATVIEPGSGSSIKTRILLESQPLLKKYIPIDISEDFLLETAITLKHDFPELVIQPLVADFTASMAPLELDKKSEHLVFFPGSTIGNFDPNEAKQLLRNIHHLAGENAWLLIGVDMTQDGDKLLAAYNDANGITAQFNKNMLVRANRELEADFNVAKFAHRAIFNQSEHRVEMHLVSQQAQDVQIQGYAFHFNAGETIHTENCYKYSRRSFEAIAHECGWAIFQCWEDKTESSFGVFLLKAASTYR
ncbi:MAG TPA: L-histidine N(alpha)-methyltransferase [Methylophilaceae bacterium]|nr:L-histidine N(alpha)-methyltransferase [Methylophilaceae bacterium]